MLHRVGGYDSKMVRELCLMCTRCGMKEKIWMMTIDSQ